MITAVVDFTKPNRLKSCVPMITFARPITMVPVPAEISKNAFLLAVYAAGQGCKAIGNCQTDDFYQPLVLSKRSD